MFDFLKKKGRDVVVSEGVFKGPEGGPVKKADEMIKEGETKSGSYVGRLISPFDSSRPAPVNSDSFAMVYGLLSNVQKNTHKVLKGEEGFSIRDSLMYQGRVHELLGSLDRGLELEKDSDQKYAENKFKLSSLHSLAARSAGDLLLGGERGDYELQDLWKEHLVEGMEKSAYKSETLSPGSKPIRKNLAEKVAMIALVPAVLFSIFFFKPDLTGNVISGMSETTSNVVGIVLLVLALLVGMLWLKERKKRKEIEELLAKSKGRKKKKK